MTHESTPTDAVDAPPAVEESTASAHGTPPGAADPALRPPDALTRFLAFLIDAVVVGALASVPFIGGLAGTAYVLFRDGLDVDFMRGRSLGKVVMKLALVRDDGGPLDLMTSFRRNWTLAFTSLTVLLIFIPILGWILIPFAVLAGLVLLVIEVVKVFAAPDGRRWGDELAGTRVVLADEPS